MVRVSCLVLTDGPTRRGVPPACIRTSGEVSSLSGCSGMILANSSTVVAANKVGMGSAGRSGIRYDSADAPPTKSSRRVRENHHGFRQGERRGLVPLIRT